ncbi:pYEATS domain-containing protein [Flavobacterium sp. GCM10023249]|uniref:pYEATS domain-containing protein n=1 Tax=unclassified Flavobacterium TaxID=196869 RepID=UPI00360619B4
MSKLPSTFFGFQDIQAFFRLLIYTVIIITLVICTGFLFFKSENRITGVLTLLMVAVASFSGGGAIGFLFGIPKSEKVIAKSDNGTTTAVKNYSDNTNLEEISDWITKIIVGISFIKFRTVMSWLSESAQSMADSLNPGSDFNFYVFSYALIVFYFLTGSGLLYLWCRTSLSDILEMSKRNKELRDKNEELETKNKVIDEKNYSLKTTVQKMANETNLNNLVSTLESSELKTLENNEGYEPNTTFREETKRLYKSKKIIDSDDLQLGRWGGKSIVQNKVLEASYQPSESFEGLCRIRLSVYSADANQPLQGDVAFFLHDTFPNEIVFATAKNNKAELSISAWEAFVVGARLEDGTELELNLNEVKGFPDEFYW